MKRLRRVAREYLKLRLKLLDLALTNEMINVYSSEMGEVSPHNLQTLCVKAGDGVRNGPLLWETHINRGPSFRCTILPPEEALGLVNERLRLINPQVKFGRLLDYADKHNRLPDNLSAASLGLKVR